MWQPRELFRSIPFPAAATLGGHFLVSLLGLDRVCLPLERGLGGRARLT